MKLELFKQHKENIKKHADYMLAKSKALGRPLEPWCSEEKLEAIKIDKDATQDEILEALSKITLKDNQTLTMKGSTYDTGRYDYFKEITFTITTTVIKESIDDEVITKHMKALVKRKLGLESWAHLDCKVMDLYKKGLIEWETVIESHSTDCSI